MCFLPATDARFLHAALSHSVSRISGTRTRLSSFLRRVFSGRCRMIVVMSRWLALGVSRACGVATDIVSSLLYAQRLYAAPGHLVCSVGGY
jgi:hypothetical protein